MVACEVQTRIWIYMIFYRKDAKGAKKKISAFFAPLR
jgi:hypothetical protein